jgi:hypothetical protein
LPVKLWSQQMRCMTKTPGLQCIISTDGNGVALGLRIDILKMCQMRLEVVLIALLGAVNCDTE